MHVRTAQMAFGGPKGAHVCVGTVIVAIFQRNGLWALYFEQVGITRLPPDMPYVCLSYVWGNAPVEDTLSLDTLPALPKTILDSIHVAVQIRITYLWIDRYCIDQNNEAEKHDLFQEKKLNAVYRDAALTIPAVPGSTPHDGLPGVNDTF
jgi:hypothetical protein